jgi:hypothetical protein
MAFPSSRCCFAGALLIATLVPCASAQRGGAGDPSRTGGAVDLALPSWKEIPIHVLYLFPALRMRKR